MKSNGEVIDRSTVRRLTLEERELPAKKEKLRVFERELEESIGTYLDDTARLLTEGKLPRNDEPPDDTVDWQDVPEHPTDDHESCPTEPTEKELVEDDNILSAEVIFKNKK